MYRIPSKVRTLHCPIETTAECLTFKPRSQYYGNVLSTYCILRIWGKLQVLYERSTSTNEVLCENLEIMLMVLNTMKSMQ